MIRFLDQFFIYLHHGFGWRKSVKWAYRDLKDWK